MSIAAVKEEARQFIYSNFMVDPQTQKFSDSDSLLRKGVLDSMGVMELVSFVQKKYGVTVPSSEILPENFDSLDNLEGYVRRKTDGGRG